MRTQSLPKQGKDLASRGGEEGVPRILRFSGRTDRAWEKAIGALDYQAIIEDSGDAAVFERETQRVESYCRWHFSFLTRTVYAHPVGRMLADALTRAYGLSNEGHYSLYTSLHEALWNAVIHGNLAVGTHYHTTHEFKNNVHLMEQAVSSPLGAKRIRVTVAETDVEHLMVSVEDEGNGFDYTCYHEPELLCISGRGIMLISACTANHSFSNGGRKIHMYFRKG